jgi:hypothetical protein
VLAIAVNLVGAPYLGAATLGYSAALASCTVAAFTVVALGIWLRIRTVLLFGFGLFLIHILGLWALRVYWPLPLWGELMLGAALWGAPWAVSARVRAWLRSLLLSLFSGKDAGRG